MKVYRLSNKQQEQLEKSALFVGCTTEVFLNSIINLQLRKISEAQAISNDPGFIEPFVEKPRWEHFVKNQWRCAHNLPSLKMSSTK